MSFKWREIFTYLFNYKVITMKLLKRLYLKIFPNFASVLDRIVGNADSLLDVGCGFPSPIQLFASRLKTVGVDAFGPSIELSRKHGIHNDYVQADVTEINKKFEQQSFDCVIALDVIEHLTKEQGLTLLEHMEKIAKKQIIIFTPNGFLFQAPYKDNPWQEHKSGWTVEEMQARGYKVFGINGWKPLRGEYARIRFWPSWFWRIISDVTSVFTWYYPKYSFQILCVKKI